MRPQVGTTARLERLDRGLQEVQLAVELDAPTGLIEKTPFAEREGLSRLELFENYYRQKSGELPDALRAAFLEAQQAVRQDAAEQVEA